MVSPPTRSQAAPRRSGRERKQVDSVYDEAKANKQKADEEVKERSRSRSRGASKTRGGKRKPSDEESEEDDPMSEDEQSEQSQESEESESESESEDEDFKAQAAAKKKKQKKKAATGKKSKISSGRSPKTKNNTTTKKSNGNGGKRSTKSASQREAHTALSKLAKNVLPDDESPGLSSLVAGLLHSYRPTSNAIEMGEVPNISEYTPNLVKLSKMVIGVHNEHPNKAQVALLNLLFRSVGGGPDSDLSLGISKKKKKSKKKKTKDDDDSMDSEESSESEESEDENEEEEEEVILDDMDTDEWARVVTDLVDDMRHLQNNHILLCADPLGAVHQSHELIEREKKHKEGDSYEEKKAPGLNAGVLEYRKIYEEFWYVLGRVALTDGCMSATASHDFESQEVEVADPEQIVRLDAELVKNLILRIIELTPVGQPDVRAAATLAALNIGHAVLDQSAILVKKLDVASRQYAAAKKKKASPGGAKADALKVRMESLKRSVEDLEEVVLGPVVQGLFVHRYRDSNEHIRTMCISSLSRMSLQRPDLFLNDKYLKYFGWMMHDKDARVRRAAMGGLLKPFNAVNDIAEGKTFTGLEENFMVEKIDLSSMEHVLAKFIPRVVDAVMDPVGDVQEVAMSLMLVLLKGGFLDDVEDEKIWDQTNLRCLAKEAPAAVQKDALYFILEQLEAFDGDGENEKAAPNERKRAQQLDAIASYAAHSLTSGPVPIDKIHVEAADLLVKSLREMPEHRGLVTDWGAMLRAIKDDNAAATAHQVTAGDRANVAKQRVLVRMLACAAREEVASVADDEFKNRGTDADAVEMTSSSTSNKLKGKKTGREHENLSIALLKSLPSLLIQFKGDLAIIPELASLPRFLIPTVFSLPQRKQDFMSLIKNLGEIYLSSSDTHILDNCARSLVSLCNGDHARVAESKTQLRKVVLELRDRIVELMSSDDSTIATSAMSVGATESDFTSVAKSKRGGRSSKKKKTPAASPSSDKTSLTDDDTQKGNADAEYAIYLNIKRLKILSKKCDLSVFFDDRNNVNQLELLCNFVCDGLKTRLRSCKPVDLRLNADEETTVGKLIDSPDVLAAISKSVGEGLEFLLCVVAWFVNSVQVSENLIVDDNDLIDAVEDDDDEEEDEVEDHVVTRLRDRLLSTLELCFAQYIPTSYDQADGESTMVAHSEEQHSFADFVQLSAGKVTSDLRTLFPKEYEDAASPILRSFALKDDGRLIGAYVRFLDSKEHLLRENDGISSLAERKLSQSLLFPLGRAVAANWTNGNRREAGVYLRHIGASGPTASEIVSSTSRTMRKIDAVRMLESQMASLRTSYENWVDDTPELETDFPSEEEMATFEEEEKAHKESFAKLEHRASQFSQMLGVFGKLKTDDLGPALQGFVREGVRFSFSNLDDQGDDSLVLGSRLSFLLLLSKYASWAKKNKETKAAMQEQLDGMEADLRNHQEFEEVHADDLDALATFRQNVGLKALSVNTRSGASVTSGRSGASVMSGYGTGADGEDSLEELPSPAPSTGTTRSRASRSTAGGSRSTAGSRIGKGALPTLEEGETPDSDADEEESRFSKKRGQSDDDDDSETEDEGDGSVVSEVSEKPAPKRASKRAKKSY